MEAQKYRWLRDWFIWSREATSRRNLDKAGRCSTRDSIIDEALNAGL